MLWRKGCSEKKGKKRGQSHFQKRGQKRGQSHFLRLKIGTND